MKKLKITLEEPNDPKNFPKTNAYMTAYGLHDCWALYVGDIKHPEIRVVKQGNFLRTGYLLLHELGHYIIDIFFNNYSLVHTYYDNIDRFLVRWKER